MAAPKKGPGQYGDNFTVVRVEGGFLLSIQHTEDLPDAEVPPLDAPGVVMSAELRAQLSTHKHQRSVVCKSTNEVLGHFREWSDGTSS